VASSKNVGGADVNYDDFDALIEKAMVPLKKDWRDSKQSSCMVFCKGGVRPRDYQIVFSLIAAHLLTLCMAIDVFLRTEDPEVFIFALVPIFHVMWVSLSLMANLFSA
jgi:hypothetical protein